MEIDVDDACFLGGPWALDFAIINLMKSNQRTTVSSSTLFVLYFASTRSCSDPPVCTVDSNLRALFLPQSINLYADHRPASAVLAPPSPFPSPRHTLHVFDGVERRNGME